MLEEDRARGCVADCGGLGEDPLHPRVRREGRVLADADGGEQAAGLRVDGLQRLLLDDGRDEVEERRVGGGDGVHVLAGDVDEVHRRRRVGTVRAGRRGSAAFSALNRRSQVTILNKATEMKVFPYVRE